MKKIYLPINTNKGRNLNSISIFLKEKPKTISRLSTQPPTSRTMNQSPILSFPLNINDKDNNTPRVLFSTASQFYNPLKKHKILKNILPNSNIFKNRIKPNNNIIKQKISKSLFNKPVILSKTIEMKIKESKEMGKLKKINIFDFGNSLKLYDDNEKKNKEKKIIDKRNKQLDDIFFDYDKNNEHIIMNSFSGNRADLLKNKVCFVKGIIDYLYPKLILQKMIFLNEIKEKDYKIGRKKINKSAVNKYYKIKHRNAEQIVANSKYIYGGDLEIIRPRKNFFEPKKTLINKCKVSKLAYDYDFI